MLDDTLDVVPGANYPLDLRLFMITRHSHSRSNSAFGEQTLVAPLSLRYTLSSCIQPSILSFPDGVGAPQWTATPSQTRKIAQPIGLATTSQPPWTYRAATCFGRSASLGGNQELRYSIYSWKGSVFLWGGFVMCS